MGSSGGSSDGPGGGRSWHPKRLGSVELSLHEQATEEAVGHGQERDDAGASNNHGSSVRYRTYKRRWFGLFQLVLMNIVVSWDWLTYAPVASKAASYYSVSETQINWISIAFFLAFAVITPLTIAVLHRGPKLSMMVAAGFMLVGNWIRYAGSSKRSGGSYVCAMLGTLLCGLGQPFVLAAPARYSDLWFSNRGRVAATALTTLANPLGAALAQLITPFWVQSSGDVSQATLYISIISTIACLPAFFLPAQPLTPVAPSSETAKVTLKESIRIIFTSPELWLILIPFFVFVGFFNSCSSLLNQIMNPYGFSDDEAGIGGAVLIVVGLVFSAIVSPIMDRTKQFMLALKVFVPVIALSYLAFIWMPETREIAGPYVVLAFLGAASFSLVPLAVEYLSELSHPVSPEVTSTIAWAGGQLCGAAFILVSNALVASEKADPPKNMKRALVFQAAVALAVVPFPLCLGLFGRRDKVVLKRIRSDEQASVIS